MDIVRIHSDINYPYVHLRASAPDDSLSDKTNLSCQDLPPVLRGYYQMICQKRHRMPIVSEFFHSSLPAHVQRYNFGTYKSAASDAKVFYKLEQSLSRCQKTK